MKPKEPQPKLLANSGTLDNLSENSTEQSRKSSASRSNAKSPKVSVSKKEYKVPEEGKKPSIFQNKSPREKE